MFDIINSHKGVSVSTVCSASSQTMLRLTDLAENMMRFPPVTQKCVP